MKRRDAFKKLSIICQRLAALNPNEFFVIPLRLYLFGSLLTNKPNPTDIDLLFQYQEREFSEREIDELLHAMTYGKPLPHNKAISYLRKGMQKVRIELLDADSSLQQWICSREFEPETPFKLIWERGFDWQTALREAETQPAEWRIEIEQRNKYLQERARQIRDEQGLSAAKEWVLKQKSGNASENT